MYISKKELIIALRLELQKDWILLGEYARLLVELKEHVDMTLIGIQRFCRVVDKVREKKEKEEKKLSGLDKE